MIVIEVKEYVRYELTAITQKFGIGDKEAVSILRRLKEHRIVKSVARGEEGNSKAVLLTDDLPVTSESAAEKHLHLFTFVGVVMVDRFVIKCYPKYINGDRLESGEMAQVLRVIEKYESRAQSLRLFDEDAGDLSMSRLAVMLFLIRDYYDNGPYQNVKVDFDVNGPGEVNWDRTISGSLALMVQGRPVYAELVTRRRLADRGNIIRRIHESVLTELIRFLRDSDLLRVFGVPDDEISDEDVDDIGELDYLIHRVDREMDVQFETRKRRVLDGLRSYLTGRVALGDDDDVELFGSTSFQLVWEDVCSEVLGNSLKRPMSELNLPVPLVGQYKGDCLFESVIERPRWMGVDQEGDFFWNSKGTLNPDVVSVSPNSGEHVLMIVDAKYYDVSFSRQRLAGEPGVGDVLKQLAYQAAFERFANLHSLDKIVNYFVMPTGSSVFSKLGRVVFGIFGDGDGVEVIQAPAELMYDYYLGGRKIDFLGVLKPAGELRSSDDSG